MSNSQKHTLLSISSFLTQRFINSSSISYIHLSSISFGHHCGTFTFNSNTTLQSLHSILPSIPCVKFTLSHLGQVRFMIRKKVGFPTCLDLQTYQSLVVHILYRSCMLQRSDCLNKSLTMHHSEFYQSQTE